MSSKEGPFPKTLEGFGYKFNEEGKLRKIDTATGNVTDIPFQFNVSSDPSYNQKRYEAVGEVSALTCIYIFNYFSILIPIL